MASALSIISEIPVDLFITRKRLGLTSHGNLTFTNGNGDLIFTLDEQSSPASVYHLLDAKGNSLISISRNEIGWQVCVGDSKDPVFKVMKTHKSFRKREAEVFSVDKDLGDFTSVFKIRGCPFQRSCTIYEDNSIVPQSHVQKLITGYINHSLLAAFVVIFFHGRI
ncbi:hypothetical protein ACHQM5_020467 [Ranunculus cassubicifolius]